MQMKCKKKRRFFGRIVEREPKTCLVRCIQLENGNRYCVDTDIIVCTMSIAISLSELNFFKKYIFYLNQTRAAPPTRDITRFGLGLKIKYIFLIFLTYSGLQVLTMCRQPCQYQHYTSQFSSYMQKNQTCFRFVLNCSSVLPKCIHSPAHKRCVPKVYMYTISYTIMLLVYPCL